MVSGVPDVGGAATAGRQSGVAVMGGWGRDGVLNQGPGRPVLRHWPGWLHRADEDGQGWLVVVNDDLGALLDDRPRITCIGVEGLRPTANLQGHLTHRARCDPTRSRS